MHNKYLKLLLIHWCLKYLPGENGRKTLVELNNAVLNRPAAMGNKINCIYICNIIKLRPYMIWFSQKRNGMNLS